MLNKKKISNLKIGGCVVLYNPNTVVLENIETYRDKLDLLVVIDNSDRPVEYVLKKLEKKENVRIISMQGNKGIARALNKGCLYLAKNNFDVCLTMDSDSRFPKKYYEKIINMISPMLKKDYGLVGLNYNYFPGEKSNKLNNVKYWLTSGNFVNLNAYKKVGGFKNDLFIDYVDIEFDHSLIKAGYKVGYLEDYSLRHKIGNPIKKKIFSKIITSMNHPPIRYYYRYRNSRYLYKTDKKYYKAKYFGEIFINIPKMLLFEKNRKRKLLMIFKGWKDAQIGKLGKFS